MILKKICSKCGLEKSIAEFSKKRGNRDGLRSECKVCQSKVSKKWREENLTRVKERQRKYREDNPGKEKARYKRYKAANIEKIKEKDRRYRKANLDKRAAVEAKRRATKLNATPPWLNAKHFKEIEAFYTEARRLTKETGVEYHVDHVMPLNGSDSCGLHVPWNLQLLTAEENLKKGTKILC